MSLVGSGQPSRLSARSTRGTRMSPRIGRGRKECIEKGKKRNRKHDQASTRFANLKASSSSAVTANGNRVVLITEADAMNPPAANSLLKILEEPPSSVYFLLASTQKQSHCCRPSGAVAVCNSFQCARYSSGDQHGWPVVPGSKNRPNAILALAGGAPMRVSTMEGSGASWRRLTRWWIHFSLLRPIRLQLAAQWDGLLKGDGLFRMEHLIEGVQRWLFDLAQEQDGR
jgi:DNA polymerase-3 subunit delta'